MATSLKTFLRYANYVNVTTTYSALAKDVLLLNSTGGAFTVTLPAAPIIGDTIKVVDVAGLCATNNVTIGRNAKKIHGIAEDLTVNINNTSFDLVYDGIDSWRIDPLEYVIPSADAILGVGSMSGGYVTRSGSNLLYAPDVSNKVMAYNGRWVPYSIPDAGVTVACTGLTVSTDYYLYAFYDFNTNLVSLDLSTTAPTLQNGISVKTGSVGRLCIARCRTDASGNILTYNEDASQHLVCNYYNKRKIGLVKQEATDSWNYSIRTWRAANNNNANRVQFVSDGRSAVEARVQTRASVASNGYWFASGIGVDSITVNSAYAHGTVCNVSGHALEAISQYVGTPSAGFHYFQWLEISEAGSTTNWRGDNGASDLVQSGIHATFMA